MLPIEIIKTDNPNKMLFGEILSIKTNPAGYKKNIIIRAIVCSMLCCKIILEPIYIKRKFKNNKIAREINIISSVENFVLKKLKIVPETEWIGIPGCKNP